MDDPDSADCCNSGCIPCILDLRLEAKKKCNNKEPEIESINAISPIKYTPFLIVSLESFECFLLLTLQYECDEDHLPPTVKFDAGQYFILKAPLENDTSDHFTRPYTPLKSSNTISILNSKEKQSEQTKGEQFQILAKIYNGGLMSKYLSKLKIGDVTLWRGPYGSYKYRPNTHRNVLIICQGVAITAMFSVINEVISNEDDNTKLMLFYCCKNMQSVMLRVNLYDLKSNWNFEYKIFLSDGIEKRHVKYKEPIVEQKLSNRDINDYLKNKDAGVLICGSKNFMQYFRDETLKLNMKVENVTLF